MNKKYKEDDTNSTSPHCRRRTVLALGLDENTFCERFDCYFSAKTYEIVQAGVPLLLSVRNAIISARGLHGKIWPCSRPTHASSFLLSRLPGQSQTRPRVLLRAKLMVSCLPVVSSIRTIPTLQNFSALRAQRMPVLGALPSVCLETDRRVSDVFRDNWVGFVIVSCFVPKAPMVWSLFIDVMSFTSPTHLTLWFPTLGAQLLMMMLIARHTQLTKSPFLYLEAMRE